jgi:hypothetical protein
MHSLGGTHDGTPHQELRQKSDAIVRHLQSDSTAASHTIVVSALSDCRRSLALKFETNQFDDIVEFFAYTVANIAAIWSQLQIVHSLHVVCRSNIHLSFAWLSVRCP